MMHTAQNGGRLVLALFCLWTGNAFAQPECHYIPENPAQALVSVCEREGNLEFDFSGEKFNKNKADFVIQLKSAIENWMLGHQLEKSDITNKRIRIWLTVPDSDPSNAQGRVEVAIRNQNVVLSFNPKSDVHLFEDAQVGILGAAHYPNAYGWRPEAVILQSTESDVAQIQSLALQAGIDITEPFAKNWYYGKTSLLNEQNARQELLRLDPLAQLVVSSQVNQIMEWVGYRGQILEGHW